MRVLILAVLTLSAFGAATPPAHARVEFCDYDSQNAEFRVISNGQRLRQFVDGNFAAARVDCNRRFAALYDGDDLYVFDGSKNAFTRTIHVDDGVTNSTLVLTRDGVLFYDGDDLSYYCGGRFSRYIHVDDNAQSRPAGRGAIQIGRETFFLSVSEEDGACSIKKF